MSNNEFLDLQAHWYKVLADSGFEDIEDYRPYLGMDSSKHLKRSCKDLARKFDQETFSHYADCRNFLCHGYFSSEIDRYIFEMYSEGLSLRDIAEFLKGQQIPRSFFYVHTRLKKIKSDLKVFLALEAEELENER